MTCPRCKSVMVLRVQPIRGGENDAQRKADYWCGKCRFFTDHHWSNRPVTHNDLARWEDANANTPLTA